MVVTTNRLANAWDFDSYNGIALIYNVEWLSHVFFSSFFDINILRDSSKRCRNKTCYCMPNPKKYIY